MHFNLTSLHRGLNLEGCLNYAMNSTSMQLLYSTLVYCTLGWIMYIFDTAIIMTIKIYVKFVQQIEVLKYFMD